MIDITAPIAVDIEIRDDGRVVWIHVDGGTALRICRIPNLTVTDHRPDPHTMTARGLPDEPWTMPEPTPRPRGYIVGSILGVVCRFRGDHRWGCWLAPPGTLTADGNPAFRLCRCHTCGIEFADNPRR